MAQHPPQDGLPASRECADCGTTVNLVDKRAYARDRATGRYGLLTPPLYEGSRVAFLRPVDGGVEWTTDVDNLVPCDREGNELSANGAA